MDMELTRDDVEIVKTKVSFLDILLLICGIVSVTIGILMNSENPYFRNEILDFLEIRNPHLTSVIRNIRNQGGGTTSLTW